MEPRIIKAANDGSAKPTVRIGRATVVIADSGTDAEVLVFAPGDVVRMSTEFHYRGTTWVITGARRDSGTLVAEPSAH